MRLREKKGRPKADGALDGRELRRLLRHYLQATKRERRVKIAGKVFVRKTEPFRKGESTIKRIAPVEDSQIDRRSR